MSGNTEALDIMESKIRDLEIRVYGEKKTPPTENFNPVIDSLIQVNTLMTAALSGMEKFNSIFKRLGELEAYLDVSQLYDNPKSMATKVDIILSMEKELTDSLTALKELEQLKGILDDSAIKETQTLRKELTALSDARTSKKEKLNEINEELVDVLIRFNDIFLDISKSFKLLNDAITKLEKEKESKKMRDE